MRFNYLLGSFVLCCIRASADLDAAINNEAFAPLRILFGASSIHHAARGITKVPIDAGLAKVGYRTPVEVKPVVKNGFEELPALAGTREVKPVVNNGFDELAVEVQNLNHVLMGDESDEHPMFYQLNEVVDGSAGLLIAGANKEDLKFGFTLFSGFAALAGLVAAWNTIASMASRRRRKPVSEEHSHVDLVSWRQGLVETPVVFDTPHASSRHVPVQMQAPDDSNPKSITSFLLQCRHRLSRCVDSLRAMRTSYLLPIWLTVLVHMLGVGVTLSTLPLFFHKIGATTSQLAIAISGFSACQMVAGPALVRLSSRVGRFRVLRFCLAGNAMAALLTAVSTNWKSVALARALGGLTAASVPVAQAAVTDVCPPGKVTSKALAKVSAAQTMGIILGPMYAGIISEIARVGFGVTSSALESRFVFAAAGMFTLTVLLLTSRIRLPTPHVSTDTITNEDGPKNTTQPSVVSGAPWFAQWICRLSSVACTYASTTAITTYALFSLNNLGYGQRQISLNQSGGGVVGLCTTLFLVPKLIDRFGEAIVCSAGLVLVGLSVGSFSLLTVQPWHVVAFMLSRVGLVLADTQAAALVARNSTKEQKAQNLALNLSAQSGSRIFAPLLASALYVRSMSGAVTVGPPGALPFLFCGASAIACAPWPLLLRERRVKSSDPA